MIPVPFTIIFPYPLFTFLFTTHFLYFFFSPYTSRRQFICIDQALSKPSIFDLNLKTTPNLSLLPDETRDRDLNSASSSF